MARIAGVDLPPQKRLWIGLTSIYGIGQARARRLAELPYEPHLILGVDGDDRDRAGMLDDLPLVVAPALERRHRRNLPVRGQRTHTNARTRKGPRRGAIAAKKKTVGKKG